MKRRFATKLILSGAAFAVSAATLVSTTYAWYVQNSRVTATDITGNVQDKDATTIFISNDYGDNGVNADWTNQVDFSQDVTVSAASKHWYELAGNYKNTASGKGLDPVTRTSTKNYFLNVNQKQTGAYSTLSFEDLIDYTGADTDTVAAKTSATAVKTEAETHRLTFNLYIQSNMANTIVRPTLIVKNTTQVVDSGNIVLAGQTAYRAIQGTSGAIVNKGEQFWTDAVQALRMEVDVNKYNGTAWEAVSSNTSKGLYDVFEIAKSQANGTDYDPYVAMTRADIDTIINDPTLSAGLDLKVFNEEALGTETFANTDYASTGIKGAHAYYFGLLKSTPNATFAETYTKAVLADANKINKTTIAEANTVYRFTFTIWLEGTDASCFDCCSNQTFEFGVDFNAENA